MNLTNFEAVDLFLNPKSVAVIGASKNIAKGGYRILNNLIVNNFKGNIYPVNPNAEGEVFNLKFKKSVLEIEDDVDLGILYIPNSVIPEILEQCIEKGIKGAIIETSGFEEVGKDGLELRDRILEVTDNFSKIRIVGPNCMGITKIDGDSDSSNEVRGGFFSSFAIFPKYKRGNIAIISQSGMLNGGYLMHSLQLYPNLGIRYSCSIGNKTDLSEIEFLEYFIEDSTVNVIAIYLESFKNPRRFIELCKKVKDIPNKTIILVKGGLTSQGQKASLSHTGALTENSHLIDALIKQSSVIQANNFQELFQYARTFSMIYKSGKHLPKIGNASMIAHSGGVGTISADLTIKYGLKFPNLSKEAYNTLVNIFPEWMPPNRFAFVDIWPAIEKAMMNKINPEKVMKSVYDILLNDDNIEGIFNMSFCFSGGFVNFEKIVQIISQASKPVFFWLVGEVKSIRRVSQLLGKYDIPAFPSLEDMIKSFRVLVQESKNKSKI